MSKKKRIITKYAQGLYKVALKEENVTQFSVRLHSIMNILKSVPELNQLFITRRVQIEDKMVMLKNILGDKISGIEMDLIVLLIENGHMLLYGEILKRFDYLLDKKSEITKVQITSSTRLPDDEVQKISVTIENKIQKKLNVKMDIDTSLMGGIKLRVGNTLIDGSVSNRLQKMRDTLIQI
jgi:F-type H+-transporting ATPase subunit delta